MMQTETVSRQVARIRNKIEELDMCMDAAGVPAGADEAAGCVHEDGRKDEE